EEELPLGRGQAGDFVRARGFGAQRLVKEIEVHLRRRREALFDDMRRDLEQPQLHVVHVGGRVRAGGGAFEGLEHGVIGVARRQRHARAKIVDDGQVAIDYARESLGHGSWTILLVRYVDKQVNWRRIALYTTVLMVTGAAPDRAILVDAVRGAIRAI